MSMINAESASINQNLGKFFFENNPWFLFFTIVVFYTFLSFLQEYFFLTDELFVSSFQEQTKTSWGGGTIIPKFIQYIAIPVFLCMHMLYITTFLAIGAAMLRIDFRFATLFKIVVSSYTLYVVYDTIILIIAILANIESVFKYKQIDVFSLNHYIQNPGYFEQFLSNINIFELLFWLILALGLKSKLKVQKAFRFVALTHGIGLVVWNVIFVFLLISMNLG